MAAGRESGQSVLEKHGLMSARWSGSRSHPNASGPQLGRPAVRRPQQDPRAAWRDADASSPSSRPGRKPDSFYRLAVAAAVLHLRDRAALEFNPIAQLAGVKRLADRNHAGEIWRRGLCLRDLLTEAIGNTLAGAEGEDVAALRLVLEKASSGNTLTSVAVELGIRRESLSRGIWTQATGLVWERLKPRLVALENAN